MILVAGATGLLGSTVTRELLAAGHPVRVLVRPASGYGTLADAGAEVVIGDLKDPPSLTTACQGIATVITTANSAARPGETVEAVDVEGNRNLIDAAREAGVDHFIFVSALGASEANPVPFMRAKALTEAYLMDSGIAWTIVRPNIFMDVWVNTLVGLPLRAGEPITLVGEARRRHSMVAVRDVAAFIVASVGNEAARNRLIRVGGPEAISWRDVVAAAERTLGRSLEVRTIQPGEPLPGVPETVSQLAAAFDGYDSPVPMEETAAEFGVRLTSIHEFADENFSRDGAVHGTAQ